MFPNIKTEPNVPIKNEVSPNPSELDSRIVTNADKAPRSKFIKKLIVKNTIKAITGDNLNKAIIIFYTIMQTLILRIHHF